MADSSVTAVRDELKSNVQRRLGDLLARHHKAEGWATDPLTLAVRYSPHVREAVSRFGDALGVGMEFSDAADLRDMVEGSQGVSRAVREGDVPGGVEAGTRLLGGSLGMAGGPLVSAKMLYPVLGAITAFHGTPHRFDKFDISKVGTGEGAQAFGHGMYFAETEGVAQDYAYKLGRPNFNFTKSGNPVSSDLARLLDDAYDDVRRRGLRASGQDAVTLVGETLQKQRTDALSVGDFDWFNRVADQQAELHRIVSQAEVPKPAGHLYKVDLKPEDDELLDWDKPLSEQSEKVRAAFRQIIGKEAGADKYADEIFKAVPTKTGGHEYKATGGELYRRLSAGTGKEFNEKLREHGVRGIKYLEGTSRAAGEGGHNYVIFDPEDIQILERK